MNFLIFSNFIYLFIFMELTKICWTTPMLLDRQIMKGYYIQFEIKNLRFNF